MPRPCCRAATGRTALGLGGLFGDTVLGAILGVVPVTATFGLKLLSVLVGAGTLAMGAFVLGFDQAELRALGRFLLMGTIMAYAWSMQALGKGAQASVRAAVALQERNQARRAERAEADRVASAPEAPAVAQRVLRADPRYGAEAQAAPAEKSGLFARMPGLLKRAMDPAEHTVLEPELVARPQSAAARDAVAPSAERIRSRIADAVRSRTEGGLSRAEPPLATPREVGAPMQLSPFARLADARGVRQQRLCRSG